MLAMGENAPDYIKRLYEVYEMQDYLEEYAATLMNETIEDGDGLYHKKVPHAHMHADCGCGIWDYSRNRHDGAGGIDEPDHYLAGGGARESGAAHCCQ